MAVVGVLTAVWLKFCQPPGSQPAPVTGEGGKPAAAVAVVPVPPPDPWHGLRAGAVTLQKAENGDLVYAVGTLRNESDRQRFGVKVDLAVFDEQGSRVGTASDYTQSILPGKEWRFKALIIDKKAARAEVAKVTEEE
jgi:hypothetical protein